MAEETSLKASEPNRAIRVVVGVAVIGVLLAALGWMVPHFIAQPARATLTQETPTGMSSGYAPHWKAEEIVEVPFGETVVLDDLDWGMKYDLEASPYLQEDWDSKTEAERQAAMESEGWEEAFTEWYPLYVETNLSAGSGMLFADEDVRMVVVDVEVGNLGTEPAAPPNPVLRCAAFTGDNAMMDAGMLPDNYAQAALYPLGGDDFIVGLAGGYDTLMPGETRTIRYAFVIYRNSFAEQDGIDNADLSAMEVAYLDCSPWRVIALKLANARDAAQVHPRNAYTDGILGR